MDVLEGWLSTGVFAVFDGRTLELYGDHVNDGRVGDTIRLHVRQIAGLDIGPTAGGPANGPPSLTWSRRDGKAFPLAVVNQDCAAFAQELIQAVERSTGTSA
jgi:hypothetical protein